MSNANEISSIILKTVATVTVIVSGVFIYKTKNLLDKIDVNGVNKTVKTINSATNEFDILLKKANSQGVLSVITGEKETMEKINELIESVSASCESITQFAENVNNNGLNLGPLSVHVSENKWRISYLIKQLNKLKTSLMRLSPRQITEGEIEINPQDNANENNTTIAHHNSPSVEENNNMTPPNNGRQSSRCNIF